MLFFVILAVVMIWFVIPNYIRVTPVMEKEVMSPRTVPYLASAGILFVSSLGFLSNLIVYLNERKKSAPMKDKKTREEWEDILFPFIVFAMIAIYGVLFYNFGIVIASIIVPTLILFCLRCRKWYMYLILYGFFAIMYTLFTVVLHVPIK